MSENNNQNNDNDNNSNMINIGGLWANRAKSNNEIYLSGYLNGAKLLILKNNFKTTDNHPDYVMYVVPRNQRPQSASADDFETTIVLEEQDKLDASDVENPDENNAPKPPEDTDDIPF